MHDDRTKMAGLDVISSIVLFLLGAGVYYAAASMRVYNKSLVVSPGLFPMILGILFMFLAVIMGGLALRRNGWAASRFMLSPAHLKACLTSPRFFRGMVVLLSILAYVLLFGRVHFIVVTTAYLLFTFIYLKAMKLPVAVITSVIAAFVIFYVFKEVFGIPVP